MSIPTPPRGYGKKDVPPSSMPCFDYVHWDQDLRDYWHQREAYLRQEGVSPEDSHHFATQLVRDMHHARVEARQRALATQPPEIASAAAERKRREADAIEREYAATQERVHAGRTARRRR